jgi:hypothetical protein
MKPTIGRIVIYRSRTGDYDCPAIVAGTIDTLNQKNVDAGLLPGCSSSTNVHLVVFTPGPPGKRATAEDFKVPAPHGIAENVGGVYQEWDIPQAKPLVGEDIEPGSWRWPKVVG